MIFTNNHNLPNAIYNAVVQDEKEKVGDISITQLTDSVRRFYLTKKHYDEITVDIITRLWALQGKAMHYILQKYADKNTFVEETLTKEINGWIVAAHPDLLSYDEIIDWKWTSVWTGIYDSNKEGFVKQLNSYKYLAAAHGFNNTNLLKNILFYKDWSLNKSKRDEGFPPIPIETIEQEVWPLDITENFLITRVQEFQKYANVPDSDLPPCTEKEMWRSNERFALMKTGRKSAIKLCDSSSEAEMMLIDKYKGATHIEHRPGEDKRCNEWYCDCCQFCDHFRALQNKDTDGV